MKRNSLKIIVLIICLMLAGCGAEAAPTEEVSLSNVYTAAASTISSQVATTATVTPTLFVAPTLFSFSPTSLATPTSQSAVSYSSFSSSVSTANGCNNAAYVSDVTIADGTLLAPGESFVKTWEFQNTGTCDWGEEYRLTFVSGNDMDGDATAIAEEVSAGSTVDISVSLVAPATEGTYTGYWRLADEDGSVFGQSVYVMIVVSDNASTTTPTATVTEEEEETEATSTSTSVPSATVAPTSTPVPTETSTITPVPASVTEASS